jgi:hypothetical protein
VTTEHHFDIDRVGTKLKASCVCGEWKAETPAYFDTAQENLAWAYRQHRDTAIRAEQRALAVQELTVKEPLDTDARIEP